MRPRDLKALNRETVSKGFDCFHRICTRSVLDAGKGSPAKEGDSAAGKKTREMKIGETHKKQDA